MLDAASNWRARRRRALCLQTPNGKPVSLRKTRSSVLSLAAAARAISASVRRRTSRRSGEISTTRQVPGTPAGGGRPTDPRWTERRLVPLAPRTLERLEEITAKIRSHGGMNLEPMQVAALLLERTTEQLGGDEAKELVDAALSRR